MTNGKQAISILMGELQNCADGMEKAKPTSENVPQCTDPPFRELVRVSMACLLRSEHARWSSELERIGQCGSTTRGICIGVAVAVIANILIRLLM